MILWDLCEQPSGNSCSCNEVAAKSFVNSEHLVALHSQAGFKSWFLLKRSHKAEITNHKKVVKCRFCEKKMKISTFCGRWVITIWWVQLLWAPQTKASPANYVSSHGGALNCYYQLSLGLLRPLLLFISIQEEQVCIWLFQAIVISILRHNLVPDNAIQRCNNSCLF